LQVRRIDTFVVRRGSIAKARISWMTDEGSWRRANGRGGDGGAREERVERSTPDVYRRTDDVDRM
jgi:hypothetical protein